MSVRPGLMPVLLLSLSSFAQAAHVASIEFFSSNNTQVITVEKAYERLAGKAQFELEDTLITVLQKNHMEQGRFENILGTYQMAADSKITADNTEIFYVSPEQKLSDEQIFYLASQFANRLKQESIAVFVPSRADSVSAVTISFNAYKPGIKEAINMIHKKLPSSYSRAFSLHLIKMETSFNKTKVSGVEWLGSGHDVKEIRKAFPGEKITYQHGKSYLVYKTGEVELL